MATIDNREAAIEAKQLYENYQAYMESDWGKKLNETIADIEQKAIDKSMRGSDPGTPAMYESRGSVIATTKLKALFTEVKKNYDSAIAWLQANPPQEGSASEKSQ